MTYDPRPRRMPALKKVCTDNGITQACFKCGKSGYVERAHMIDRMFGGLDLSPNLRPLCSACHRYQPIFRNGDEAEAEAWFAIDSSPMLGVLSDLFAVFSAAIEAERAAS